MSKIDLSPVKDRLAVSKPSIIGAAIKILALGGSSLSEKEQIRAAGSSYLMKTEGEEILALVREFER